MIVRGIAADGDDVYLELEVHGLARRLIVHVQTRRGGKWLAFALDLNDSRALLAMLAVHCDELARWTRSATSAQDQRAREEVARGLRSAGVRRPPLPPAEGERVDVELADDDGVWTEHPKPRLLPERNRGSR